jgi:hypothetical protein
VFFYNFFPIKDILFYITILYAAEEEFDQLEASTIPITDSIEDEVFYSASGTILDPEFSY